MGKLRPISEGQTYRPIISIGVLKKVSDSPALSITIDTTMGSASPRAKLINWMVSTNMNQRIRWHIETLEITAMRHIEMKTKRSAAPATPKLRAVPVASE